MSVCKLTVAGLCAQAAITATLIILSMMSGAGLPFYLLAAAYALTGLFFLELIYTRVLAPSARCASAHVPTAHINGRTESGTPDAKTDLEDLATRIEALRASAEASRIELNSLLDALPAAVLEIDMDGKVSSANEAAVALTEYNPSEIKGRQLSSFIAKEDLDDADDQIHKALSGTIVNSRELRLLSKSGVARSIVFTTSPIRIEGQITGYRCIALESDRSKALEAALKEARTSSLEASAKLEKAERDLEQFALIAIRREIKMREIRERLFSHDNSLKR